jgi:hypothetical protein
MSDSVDTWVLADIRRSMVKTRPDSVRILRYTRTTGTVEGAAESWIADPTTVHGSLSSGGLTDSERTIALKITDVTVWVITLPWDVAVTTRDRVQFETIDGLAISPFRQFDVRYASAETGQWNQRVLAIEIGQDADA